MDQRRATSTSNKHIPSVAKLPSIHKTSLDRQDVSPDEVQDELELVQALKEQVALQRQLLEYEYTLETGKNTVDNPAVLQKAYYETERAIRTAHGQRRKYSSGTKEVNGELNRTMEDQLVELDDLIIHPTGPL
eukprot:gene7644-7722_t